MATSGGQPGNKNASKAKVWNAAIMRALEARSLLKQKNALDDLAEKLLDNCMDGDLASLKELGDRLDGKAAQSVTVGGDEDNPLIFKELVIRAVDATNDRSTKEG